MKTTKKFYLILIFLFAYCSLLNASVCEYGVFISNFIKNNYFQYKDNSLNLINLPETLNTSTPYQNNSHLIKAIYTPCSISKVNDIIKKYKNIPGGITLEGIASGLPLINNAKFDFNKNSFIFNDNKTCYSGLSLLELKEIFKAVYQNDLVGVSLGEEDIVYGALNKVSIPAILMKMTDHFLGSIVFAGSSWTKNHLFPGGYKLKPDFNAGGYAVYFNFYDFNFKADSKSVNLDNLKMEVTLIPLSNKKNADNSSIPDYNKISKGTFSKAFESNVKHIVKEISFYENDPRFKKVIEAGKAAAIARSLKQKNIPLSKIF